MRIPGRFEPGLVFVLSGITGDLALGGGCVGDEDVLAYARHTRLRTEV